MSTPSKTTSAAVNRFRAQESADRLRLLREELTTGEAAAVLALTPDQQQRFEEWSRSQLAALSIQFDIDTSESQKRVSWGMRVASTLGGIALCAAVVLFFNRYWGYLETWMQLVLVVAIPFLALGGAEWMARRERSRYFTGLLSLVALASFVLNLVVIGDIFNIVSTERALLAWGLFALLLAYRYGLRLLLALALLLLMSYASAASIAQFGYHWLDFANRPEHYLLLGMVVFAIPLRFPQAAPGSFAPVYRIVGVLTFFVAVWSLAGWGASSYLPLDSDNVERLYQFAGLALSVGAIWLGIRENWSGIVNIGAVFFTIFLFTRLYHWLWDWLPRYAFFAIVGAIAIALVVAFKRIRARQMQLAEGHA